MGVTYSVPLSVITISDFAIWLPMFIVIYFIQTTDIHWDSKQNILMISDWNETISSPRISVKNCFLKGYGDKTYSFNLSDTLDK